MTESLAEGAAQRAKDIAHSALCTPNFAFLTTLNAQRSLIG